MKVKRSEVFTKTNGHCSYCGEQLNDKWHVDHKVSKRYAEYHKLDMEIDHIDNLMPSCPSCNIYKKEFTLEAFREQLGLLTGRLQKTNTIYKIAKRYELIEETNKPIVFYFEKIGNG
jgi:5-methylcytosine-specific restriction endonuclease McrA